MSEEGKKRKAEDDRDGDSNVNGGATGPELSIPRTHTLTYKRHNLKYFKSIRRGSEFAFDVLTTGWSRVPVNEYRFCLKTKRYRGERPEITFKLRVLEYRFQILWLLTTM